MRYTSQHRRQGLSVLDVKILTALDRSGPLQSYPLSVALGEKRTSVDYRLQRLCRLGWLVTEARGRRYAYDLTPEARELTLSSRQGIEFDQYATLSELLVALRAVISVRTASRLYFIEPSGIAQATLIAMGEEHETLQALIKRSGKVAEGVVGKAMVRHLSEATWDTLRGRLFEMYEIEDSLLAFADIVWVADDTTFLVNPATGRFRSLRDTSFADSMRALVQTLEHFGTKVNPHLRQLT